MENQKQEVSNFAKKFDSVEATIEGPFEVPSNGKMYYKAKFEENTGDDDGYSSQSKAYTKCFFEDSHSLIYAKCEKAQETESPLKIRAARIRMKTDKSFYILDKEGKKRKNSEGEFITASEITMFLLPDESPATVFKQQCKQITKNNAWIAEAEEEFEAE